MLLLSLPLSSPWLLLLQQGGLRDQYVSELAPGQLPLDRVKLLVCGGPGVGKTELIDSLKCHIIRSLFRRRSISNFQQMLQQRTHGMNIQLTTVPNSGLFSIWDFSGIREFYAAHENFLNEANSIFILVMNLRDPVKKQLAQMRFWLAMIKAKYRQREILARSVFRRPFVILVGSFADQQQIQETTDNDSESLSSTDVFALPRPSHTHQLPDNGRSVLEKLSGEFSDFFIFSNTVFAVDCRLSQSQEMKSLRSLLGSLHTKTLKVIYTL